MSNIKSWSSTAASNTDASWGGMPEGMAPSAVNDNVRTQMAAHRTQWEDAEWFDWGHAPAYVSASTFTVSNSVTLVYALGRRLKLYDGSNTLFGHVTTISAVSGTNTKFTVSLTSGNLTSSLSSVAVSIQNPTNTSIPKGAVLDTPTVTSAQATGGTFTSPTIVTPTMSGTTLTFGNSSAVATTSGSTVVLSSSIPSWARKITITFVGVSSDGTAGVEVQLGDSGGYETTNYFGAVTSTTTGPTVGTAALSSGFALSNSWGAGLVVHGSMILTLLDTSSNTWVCQGVVARTDSAITMHVAGSKALSGTLTQVRLTAGANAFDAGSANLIYE
jgi:hypothetical protein